MAVIFNVKAFAKTLIASTIMALICICLQLCYYRIYLVPAYIGISLLAFIVVFIKMLSLDELELIEQVLPKKMQEICKKIKQTRV